MESAPLSNTQKRYAFFTQTVLSNVQYWQTWLKDKAADAAALDKEQNNIVKAISFALDLQEAWSLVYELIVEVSPHIERRGHWDVWGKILSRAIEMARRVGDAENEANLSALLGLMLQRQSRFKEAIAQHQRTIQTARRAGNQFALARAYTNLGYLYSDRGYWYRAEVLCCHALNLFEQVESDYGRAHTENHLGLLYMRQHRWELAQQHFERAYAIWEASGDAHGLLKGLINFSALYIKQEQPDQALDYLEEAQQQVKRIKGETEVGLIYHNKGIAYKLKGELTEAEKYHRRAEMVSNKFSNLKELALIWDSLGIVYTLQEKWQKAAFYLKKTLKMWQELGSVTGQINTLFNFIDYAVASGDDQQAIIYLRKIETVLKQNVQDSALQRFHTQLDQYRRNLIA